MTDPGEDSGTLTAGRKGWCTMQGLILSGLVAALGASGVLLLAPGCRSVARFDPIAVDWSSEVSEGVADYQSRMTRLTGPVLWAPELCRAMPPVTPIFSSAPEDSPHGRKLYHLYTDDAAGYRGATGGEDEHQPLTLVKEARMPLLIDQRLRSWTQEDMFGSSGSGMQSSGLSIQHRLGVARSPEDGKLYAPGLVTSLFVMRRVGDANTPGTDQGWIYGVTNQDGSQIWDSGLIASCIECHRKAPHGRLFGLPEVAAQSD
ncbi:MAG: hypothetical protein AB8F26_06730 [Phycisphaerales bacterium]